MSKQNGTKIWVLGKNGNFVQAYGTKDKAIQGMRDIGRAPKAEISDQKDGSVRLKGLAHYRAKEVEVS